MKEATNKQFGKQVRGLRIEYKLTQEELASRSKLSLKYIQRIEGKNPPNPSLMVLEKIATAFEMPLWKLLKF